MSLFGSLMGDFEDDPIFGTHMQSMNGMMSSFFGNPFGMMGPGALMPPDVHRHHHGERGRQNNAMMPFGFPGMGMPAFNMNDMFAANFNNMGSGQGMTSTSIMTYSSGPDGRPQIYQASKSMRAGPGGIKEVKESVYDSSAGTKKLAIGHHIGDRAHIVERKKDLNNGEEEEHQEFINLDDDEAESFNQEWQSHVRPIAERSNRSHRALEHESNHHRKRNDPKRLALTDGTSSQQSNRSKSTSTSGRRPVSAVNKNSRMSGAGEQSQETNEIKKALTETSTSRKRERKDDNETSKKRHISNSHD